MCDWGRFPSRLEVHYARVFMITLSRILIAFCLTSMMVKIDSEQIYIHSIPKLGGKNNGE